jgi:hypothetical protein
LLEVAERHGCDRVRGDVHTNSIELQVKRGINGTYVWVSKKHCEYRHNLRRQAALMFELLFASLSEGAG